MGNREDINECKILPQYEILYIESLLTKTTRAIVDYEFLIKIINTPTLFKENSNKLIDLAENIVNQGAGISRFLFPVRHEKEKHEIHKLRGEELRESLQIGDNCPLKNRDVRNYVEHFDEKLDKFLSNPVAGNVMPSAIVMKSSELNDTTFIFRAYVIEDFKFICLKSEICIKPIIEEIYRIHNLLIDFISNGGRLKKNICNNVQN